MSLAALIQGNTPFSVIAKSRGTEDCHIAIGSLLLKLSHTPAQPRVGLFVASSRTLCSQKRAFPDVFVAIPEIIFRA